MTAARFAPCRCGHSHAEHQALAPQCSAGHCTCLRYQPATAVEASGPTAEQLLGAGNRSHAKRTVALAGKITGLLTDLRARLIDERAGAEARAVMERAHAETRKQIADLEAQLAAAKAMLRGRTPPAATRSTRVVAAGDLLPCRRPDCGRSFDTPQGRAAHERRAHDGFNPRAAKAG
jgi:hypothetical protein